MRSNVLAVLMVVAVLLAFAGGEYALHQLSVMSSELQSMSTDLDSVSTNLKHMSGQLALLQHVDARLAETNAKLTKTNSLLGETNGSLDRMLAASRAADAKLARMEGDISVMSHKIAGSFLFRGVK